MIREIIDFLPHTTPGQAIWEMFFCKFYDYLLFTDILFEEAAVKKDVLQLCGLYSDVR